MTKTHGVGYKQRRFLAYDVAKGVLLKFLVDCAEDYCRESTGECVWVAAAIAQWRIEAITDFGFTIDDSWTTAQTAVFLMLVGEACDRLERRRMIPASEIESWNLLDGHGVFARGETQIETQPVVELGRAIIALVEGTLPTPPPSTWWLFGAPGGVTTIAMTTPTDSLPELGSSGTGDR